MPRYRTAVVPDLSALRPLLARHSNRRDALRLLAGTALLPLMPRIGGAATVAAPIGAIAPVGAWAGGGTAAVNAALTRCP